MNSIQKNIAVIPGDGIGKEVVHQATKVLLTLNDIGLSKFNLVKYPFGADEYLKYGTTIPDEVVRQIQDKQDAILFGALGDPRIPDMRHARDIFSKILNTLDLTVELRPVRILHPDLYPITYPDPLQVDFTMVYNATAVPENEIGGEWHGTKADNLTLQNLVQSHGIVKQAISLAFETAHSRERKKLVFTDRTYQFRHTHDLWVRLLKEMHESYPDVSITHTSVESFLYDLLRDPAPYDVILTTNMYGDLLSRTAAFLQGGLGMGCSAYINPGKFGLFKPVHGSAPKFAGKNFSNPFGSVLSLQMMMEFFGYPKLGKLIQDAVQHCLNHHLTTRDLQGSMGTEEVGDYLCQAIESLYKESQQSAQPVDQ